MAVTVRDLKNALSVDPASFWLLDEDGRSWEMKDGVTVNVFKMSVRGFSDSDYLAAINECGDMVLSASGGLPHEFRLLQEYLGSDALVLSGKVIGSESYYKRK